MRQTLLGAVLVLALGGMGCGGDDDEKGCDPGKRDSCEEGQVCERVQNSVPQCFAPVRLEGKVMDLTSQAGIAGAEVTALDINGAPVTAVVSTDVTGGYSLRIPSERADASGRPLGKELTLRVAAQNYTSFPSGIRTALPIDTSGATAAAAGEPFVVSGELTDVLLLQLPTAERGHPSIRGIVDQLGLSRSSLVVAEGNGRAFSTVADRDGTFRIFNVPPGAYQLKAYARGVNFEGQEVTVAAGTDAAGLRLERTDAPTATLSGDASIVAATGKTSIVLVVESTFNEALVRGETPPGLRAPEPGTAPDVSGAFSIDGVPDGRYVVLAAFENDGLVRDPDPNISGTDIQRVTVANGVAGSQPSFKVTGAVNVVSPGDSEALDVATRPLSFSWVPYSSTKSYEVKLIDATGAQVWTKTVVATTGGNNTLAYDGPALESGRIFQWRVTALSNAGAALSTSEDLKGVFRLE